MSSTATVRLNIPASRTRNVHEFDHDLTLVIPAYNEEQRLPRTLTDARAVLDSWGLNYRVLVVDDGSRDATASIASRFGRRFSTISQQNRGKGAAVRTGILASTGRVVAFTDADLPYDLSALKMAYKIVDLENIDVVLGSRVAKGASSQVRRRPGRTLASFVFRNLMSILVSRQISDTQCGLKVFSRRAATRIFSNVKTNGFAFDAEVVFLAHLYDLKVETIPVTLLNEFATTISLTRHALPMLLDVLQVRLRSLRGEYRSDIEPPSSPIGKGRIGQFEAFFDRKAA